MPPEDENLKLAGVSMAGRESVRRGTARLTKLRGQKDLSRSRVEMAFNSRRMALQSSTGSSWGGRSRNFGCRSRHLANEIILWITLGGLLILRFWALAFFDTSTMSEVPEQIGGGKMEFLAGGVIVALFIISLVIAKRVRR